MKKLFSILLVAVFMLSIVSLNIGISAFAENSTDEVSVTDDSSEEESAEASDEVSTDVATESDGSFAMTFESLKIMGFGMIGIFIVTGILVIVMYLLSFFKDKKEQ